MDPNATYRLIMRELPKALDGDTVAADVIALAFDHLNDLLCAKGFLPTA